MKYSSNQFRPLLLAAVFVASALVTTSQAKAGVVFNQIGEPFVPTALGVLNAGVSQFDKGAPPPFREDYATFFDNFSFSQDLFVTSFSWLGTYLNNDSSGLTTFPAEKFEISIFANDTTTGPFASQPAMTSLYTFDVGMASETPLVDSPGYYEYSADVTPFAVMGGETYWFSVVAVLPYQDDVTIPPVGNVWAVPFTEIGDDISIQDFENSLGGLDRQQFAVDLSFSVTAVPEPSSLFAFAAIGLFTGFRRRRRGS